MKFIKKLICRLFNLVDPDGGAVVIFKVEPTPGDSITVGTVVATFKKI